MFGVHVTKSSHVLDDKTEADTLSEAIARDAGQLELKSVQVFTYGPRFLVPNKVDFDEVKKVVAERQLDISVHSAYATTGIWKIFDKSLDERKKAIAVFSSQMRSCEKIGAWGMVLHVTKVDPETVAKVMKKIMPVAVRTNVKIVLEMVANKAGALTYETPEKINHVTELIGDGPWGWCIDTAHLWGAGVDVKKYASMAGWLERLQHKDRVLQIHLNGSSAARASGKDKHEIAFSPDDLIWYKVKPEESGLKAIVEFALERHLTVTLEVNRGAEKYTRALLAILNGWAE